MKITKKAILIILAVVIYTIPIALICVLSASEVEEYSQDIDFEFKEMAYGEIMQVVRKDMREYYSYDGKFVSDVEKVIEVPYAAKIYVKEDEEIFEGMTIAMMNGKEFVADINGVVSSIDYGDSIVIRIDDISSLLFECQVPKEQIDYFETDTLYDQSDNEIRVVKKSNVMKDGFIRVYLKLKEAEYYYGETVEDFQIYSGKIFRNALVISSDCVYKKTDEQKYYVRRVSETGEFLGETEVSVGYQDEKYVCITGVEEGNYCDAGYKKIVNSEED